MYFRNGEKHKLFRFFRTTDLRWVLDCRKRHLVGKSWCFRFAMLFRCMFVGRQSDLLLLCFVGYAAGIKALMPTCDHDAFLRAVRGMCQKSIDMSGEAQKKHYQKIRADNAAMKAARQLQTKKNAKLHARAQAAVQFLVQARKKFKAGKDMQDLDAIFCDFGMGEQLCLLAFSIFASSTNRLGFVLALACLRCCPGFFAIVQAQGSGHSAGPLRDTWPMLVVETLSSLEFSAKFGTRNFSRTSPNARGFLWASGKRQRICKR